MERARLATIPLFEGLPVFKSDVWALDASAPEAVRRLRSALEQHLASR